MHHGLRDNDLLERVNPCARGAISRALQRVAHASGSSREMEWLVDIGKEMSFQEHWVGVDIQMSTAYSSRGKRLERADAVGT